MEYTVLDIGELAGSTMRWHLNQELRKLVENGAMPWIGRDLRRLTADIIIPAVDDDASIYRNSLIYISKEI